MMDHESAVLHSTGPDHTYDLGRALGLLVEARDVIGLTGDLGAGKTRLAQGIAAGLGVPADHRVTSPSFTLINEYSARLPLAHIDLYRLADLDEVAEIGLDDYLGREAVCVIEWVERCEELLPHDHLRVHLAVTGDETRRLEVVTHGARHRRLALAWRRATQPNGQDQEDNP
jgi:tRNA threonylcarbamoyladenosine biosynthesis protein TsaE